MLYHAYELTHAAVGPMRTAARMGRFALSNPYNPIAPTLAARTTAAAFEMFVNATRRYGKPEFGIDEVEIGDETHAVTERVVMEKPFCNLVHFAREGARTNGESDPPVLIVAPLSGHFATLVRGTVEAMLPEHEVYVVDWIDAREVPVADGTFDLADYADYMIEFCRFLARRTGERPAVVAVCQPGVPVMVAGSVMAEDADPARPSSMVLMGSPIDSRINATEPNRLAEQHSLAWFERHAISTVPWPNAGFLRRVYPGFLQLSGFMSMNLDRHVDAHVDQYRNLVRGDGDSAATHRAFYDEYLAVMDLTAEFYLQTVEAVFQKHLLPLGEFRHRDRLVRPEAITDVATMTIEGERDDITGRGQTIAALRLLAGLPDDMKMEWTQPKVGHYGVFNGSRFRQHIQPRMRDFIRRHRAS